MDFLDPLNLWSDPQTRARQDQLNAQWNALWGVWQNCDNTPDSAFAEFATDLKAWREFYNSASDFSAASINATNSWQQKAKDWSDKLTGWGCTGNQSSDDLPSGIPGVKAPPPDEQSLLSKATSGVGNSVSSFLSTLTTIGWVAVGIVVFLVLGIIYTLTHVKVSSPTGSIG